MRKGRILLISPQYRIVRKKYSIYSKNTQRRAQPLVGIGSIATVLKERGHTVKYLDTVIEGIDNTFPFDDITDCYGLSHGQVVDYVMDFHPDIIGISCLFTSQFPQAMKVAADIKRYNKNIPIVVGGNHASLNTNEVMKHECFDYIVKGEGEFLFCELVEAILSRQPLNTIRHIVYRDRDSVRGNGGIEHVKDMDKLPYFDWKLVPLEKYWDKALPQNPFSKSKKTILYETSRGCPEKCIFCSTAQFFGNRFRPKSAARVTGEIRQIVKNHKVEEVEFTDDNIALDIKRFSAICEGLEDLKLFLCCPSGIRLDYVRGENKIKEIYTKMKKAGFYQITFAVESGNEYVLNEVIRKRLDLNRMKRSVEIAKDFGFKTHAFFIIGFPYETREQINDTISYAEKLQADSYSFSLANPFPPTNLWEWCKKDNLFKEGFRESDLILGKSAIKRFDDLSPNELEDLAEKVVAKLNVK